MESLNSLLIHVIIEVPDENKKDFMYKGITYQVIELKGITYQVIELNGLQFKQIRFGFGMCGSSTPACREPADLWSIENYEAVYKSHNYSNF